MVYTKTEYRYLVTKDNKSRQATFRVPTDFPLSNSEMKLLLSEFDRLISDEDDLEFDVVYLQETTQLSKKVLDIIVKLMDYYKKKKPDLDKRLSELVT